MFKRFTIFIIIGVAYSQICSSPIAVTNTLIQGSCSSDSTVSYSFGSSVLGDLNGLSAFTVSVWFRPDIKVAGRADQALFRVTGDPADVTSQTAEGVRLGLYFGADSTKTTSITMEYANAKSTTPSSTFSQSFSYTDQHWVFAYAGLDYTSGTLSYFAWQPFNPSVKLNPQPVKLAASFNSPLQSSAKLELLYWGTRLTFCGAINNVMWYPGYVEVGYQHNWINLAFISQPQTFNVLAYYKLEDQNGQALRDATGLNSDGCLGATIAVEATADPVFTSTELQFSSGQYATLPGVKFNSSNLAYGVSFYFKTSATITADGDNADLVKDIVLLKRYQKGTTDIFGILIYAPNSNQFATKIKLHGTVQNLQSLLHSINTWHFISVRVAYPNAVTELSKIMFDVVLENNVFQAHVDTPLTTTYADFASDTIVLGSKSNGFTGNLWLSHVQFYSTYVSYINENVLGTFPFYCNTDCVTSLNTQTTSQCLMCSNSKYLDQGKCIGACVNGPTALTNNNNKLCQQCPYQCATCDTAGVCITCSSGYFLQNTGNSCVISSKCNVPLIGDPSLRKCVNCGNGKVDGSPLEACDDGNFVSDDGCSSCTIDAGYVCTGTAPSVCQLRCGNGVKDTSAPTEQCDDGNQIPNDGCTTCTIDAGYYCIEATPSSKSICQLKCGNGVRETPEECDDGNSQSQDGCSATCKVEAGYSCVGSTPDVCTLLCGNGAIDFGEQCDDGNKISGDGCTDCVVDSGWSCPNNLCQKVCGNGIRDVGEQCDNGISVPGSGCTNCKVDTDYICIGGSSTSQDVCKAVPEICGDGIKKSTEQCDDGNTVSDDGCSQSCQVEVGFICYGGSQYSKDNCFEICGDGRVVGNEVCDDGNVYGGDGCDEYCKTEILYVCQGGTPTQKDNCYYTCGNGIRDKNEQCDDDNNDNGDGCTGDCKIEPGWGCNSTEDGSRDLCYACVPRCSQCADSTANGCQLCYDGFYLHIQSKQCLAGCPQGYARNSLSMTCDSCSVGCSSCYQVKGKYQCQYCQSDYYIFDGQCFTKCPVGYYNHLNVISGNTCLACTSPCQVCTSDKECLSCSGGYYLSNSVCKACNMGDQCLTCDIINNICTLCKAGYYRSGNTCLKMFGICGDGLLDTNEICDDGNTQNGDGCSYQCQVENKWNCILEDPQGPSICYYQAPPNVTTSTRTYVYDSLYLHFSRPLQNVSNFTSLTQIQIPGVDNPNLRLEEPVNSAGIVIVHRYENLFIPYNFTVQLINPSTLQIKFIFRETIQNKYAIINFTQPSQIVDIYGWSLAGQVKGRILQNDQYTMQAPLQYYIYYDEFDTAVSKITSWFMFIVVTAGFICCLYYQYEVGEGRNWKLLEVVQMLSILRFLNFRYCLSFDLFLERLDYYNGTFVYNIFTNYFTDNSVVPDKFEYFGYQGNFFLGGGGRFLSWYIYIFLFLLVNALFHRYLKFEALEFYSEQVWKYFRYQGLIRVAEILEFDVMISVMLQINSFINQKTYIIDDYIGIAIASLVLLIWIFCICQATKKFILNKRLAKVQHFYDIYGCLFDCISFDSPHQKLHSIVPFVNKIFICVVMVFSKDPNTTIPLIIFIRLLPLLWGFKYIPFIIEDLYIKEVVFEVTTMVFIISTYAFEDYYSPLKQKDITTWGLMGLLFMLVIFQFIWARFAIMNIEKFAPALIPEEMPHEEKVSEEEQTLKGKPVNVREQGQKMQNMERDFFGDM